MLDAKVSDGSEPAMLFNLSLSLSETSVHARPIPRIVTIAGTTALTRVKASGRFNRSTFQTADLNLVSRAFILRLLKGLQRWSSTPAVLASAISRCPLSVVTMTRGIVAKRG